MKNTPFSRFHLCTIAVKGFNFCSYKGGSHSINHRMRLLTDRNDRTGFSQPLAFKNFNADGPEEIIHVLLQCPSSGNTGSQPSKHLTDDLTE